MEPIPIDDRVPKEVPAVSSLGLTEAGNVTPSPAAPQESYWLTRFVLLRLLGVVYLAAYLSLALQVLPLIGAHGLLPAASYLARVETHIGAGAARFLAVPTVFWWGAGDRVLVVGAWTGVVVSLVVALGFANSLVLAFLWALYLSFINIGQDWYGYGWEIQLAETGFLAIFLCPLLDPRPFPRRPPPFAVIVLYRWLIVRIMLGAGLIKLRGDPCWRDLTCLYYHYETQPIPNPVSRTLHFMPHWFNQLGTLFNHVTELGAPWFAFGPRRARHAAGAVMLAFQIFLIVSGNLSFLNWLTIVPILACFDDSVWRRFLPAAAVARAEGRAAAAVPSRAQRIAVAALVVVVAILSIGPVANLLSSRQIMNTSFSPLALVNTYGAFGSVGRERDEIVFEGTSDPVPGDDADWKPYEFPCKPGDVMRRPCFVAPYQPRLDWAIWFAAMSTPERYPWTLHLVWKLLHNDPGALSLLAGNPFRDAPPRWIRARLYRYAFAPPGDPSGAWWTRTLVGEWLPPLDRDDPRLHRFLAAYGWIDGGDE
ncbi:MAG TPA: lipase maturation factor family protein [Candidatus Binatia bacterium]